MVTVQLVCAAVAVMVGLAAPSGSIVVVTDASGTSGLPPDAVTADCPAALLDCTVPLATALASCASTVLVPLRGLNLHHAPPWVTGPITLSCSDQEIVLQSGVVIEAKRWAFRGKGDSLLTINDLSNITVRAEAPGSATLRMWRGDYANATLYNHSEGRHGMALHGVTNVLLHGLAIEESGGDGIYIANSWSSPARNSANVTVAGVTSTRNYRQGMSVIGVVGLNVVDTVLSNTNGTAPMAGVDFEPNSPENRLAGIVFANVTASGNAGRGFQLSLMNQGPASAPIDIQFTNCTVRSGSSYGLSVSGNSAGLPPGSTVLVDTMEIENTAGAGILVENKDASLGLVLRNVTVRAVALAANAPVWIEARPPGSATANITLDVAVYDSADRAALLITGRVYGVVGAVRVTNPNPAGCAAVVVPPNNSVNVSCTSYA
eukprot:m.46179 g.46179  ORF g.46179 m.46179 type:complete len:433 (+) comp15359_c0_seq1:211-1509(+)